MNQQLKQFVANMSKTYGCDSLAELEVYVAQLKSEYDAMHRSIAELHTIHETDSMDTLIHEARHLKMIATAQATQLSGLWEALGSSTSTMLDTVKELQSDRKILNQLKSALGLSDSTKCLASIQQLQRSAWAPVDAELDQLKENSMLLEHLLTATECTNTMELISAFKAHTARVSAAIAATYKLSQASAKSLTELLSYTGCTDVKQLCKEHNQYKSQSATIGKLLEATGCADLDSLAKQYITWADSDTLNEGLYIAPGSPFYDSVPGTHLSKAPSAVPNLNLDTLVKILAAPTVSVARNALLAIVANEVIAFLGKSGHSTLRDALFTINDLKMKANTTRQLEAIVQPLLPTQTEIDNALVESLVDPKTPQSHAGITFGVSVPVGTAAHNTLLEVRKILGLTKGDNVLTRLKQLVDAYVEGTDFLLRHKVRSFELAHERIMKLLTTDRHVTEFLATGPFESLEHAVTILMEGRQLADTVKAFTDEHGGGQLCDVSDMIEELRKQLQVAHTKLYPPVLPCKTDVMNLTLPESMIRDLYAIIPTKAEPSDNEFSIPVNVRFTRERVESVTWARGSVTVSSGGAAVEASKSMQSAIKALLKQLDVSSVDEAHKAIANIKHHNAQGAKALTAAIDMLTAEMKYCYGHAVDARALNDVARSARHLERGDRLRNGLNDVKALVK